MLITRSTDGSDRSRCWRAGLWHLWTVTTCLLSQQKQAGTEEAPNLFIVVVHHRQFVDDKITEDERIRMRFKSAREITTGGYHGEAHPSIQLVGQSLQEFN